MSEYWKSTPKYWCKFCSVYVRDTKLERQNHEATGRHQGNIQRSLRGLHRDHEREEREKQRAKDEVARLNGVVGGAAPSSSTASGAPRKSTSAAGAPVSRQATVEDRKRQMQQLADLGVAIPEEFRRDMAIVGDWQTVAVTPLDTRAVKHEDADTKPDGKSTGVRKRKVDGLEEEEDTAESKRPQWGTSKKTFTGTKVNDDDFDALLAVAPAEKLETPVKDEALAAGDVPPVKDEAANTEEIAPTEPTVKTESSDLVAAADSAAPASGVVFKKRKKKP